MEYHVLVAEDEHGIRSILREWFAEEAAERLPPADYVIYEAGDGDEAMTRIAECQASGHSLDMAIIDLIMPGRSGAQVIDNLLGVSPSTKVVVFSATAELHEEELRTRYGCKVTVIGKPVRRLEFMATVMRALSGGNSYA